MGQAIERLGFQAHGALPAIEIAIHVARYLTARQFCEGRTVLDVACGEGYGAFLMADRWDAARVHGVDISPEAIQRARELFPSDRVTFHQFSAEELEARFEPGTFDLIVCLETFEHVADPAAMLSAFRRLLRPDGVVLVSCPNDYCYYGSPHEGNPFHRQKFAFDEFRALAEQALGPAAYYLLGAPVAGYVTIEPPAGVPADRHASPRVQIQGRGHIDALLTAPDEPADWTNCNYFLGVWGPQSLRPAPTATLYPINMHVLPPHRQAQFEGLEVARQAALTARAEALAAQAAAEQKQAGAEAAAFQARERAAAAERELLCVGLRGACLNIENEFVREECTRLRHLIYQAEQRERALHEQVATLERDLRQVGLRAAALQAESEFRYRTAAEALSAPEIQDMQRRIANIDRMKRMIPRPVWGLFRLVFARR